MKKYSTLLILSSLIFFVTMSMSLIQCTNSTSAQTSTAKNESDDPILANAKQMLAEGRQTFRFETFGDETYWTDALQLNKAIADGRFATLMDVVIITTVLKTFVE